MKQPFRFFLLLTLCFFCGLFAAFSPLPAAAKPGAVPVAAGVAQEEARPNLDFTLHKLGPGEGPTLLVVGGIQGDEPGGFSAASLLVTHYTITSGRVWVVPNLNFPSIVTRSRGTAGDMNRKFARLEPDDPDYAAVRRIQEIIRAPEVDLILNLHDGSGFYRPRHEGPLHNPSRWGQCVIIDQEDVHARPFGRLKLLAEAVISETNTKLLTAEHRYHLRNTETGKGDAAMEKSLSYFAVRHGKPAFGVEASKNVTTEYRAYYHITILESFMRQMNIGFRRNFTLSPAGVKTAINSDIGMALYDNRLLLALDDVRPNLTHVPMKKNAPVDLKRSSPLLALLRDNKTATWRVAYGNRTLTRLSPQYIEYDESLPSVEIHHSARAETVPMGRMVVVGDSFMVHGVRGYRVNAIGARREKADGSECGILLRKKDFLPRFSVDKGGTTYRVEIYKGKAFAGMILVRFGKALPSSRETMTAVKGPESDFGF